MIKIINPINCSGCSACASACPSSCISMTMDNEGFRYPNVNVALCINCGLCEKVCPIITPKKDTTTEVLAFAAFTKKDSVREKSSSGGVFYELGMSVIEEGGIVFGVGLDKNLRIVHSSAENEEELLALLGSKYAQSDTSIILPSVKKALDNGRLVLFSGTPCQIGGLHSYLRKPYDNLILIDLICHGVPSEVFWGRYIKHRERKAETKVMNAAFRCKESGWREYSVKMEFDNGCTYKKKASEDCYIKAFLSNLALRPSCYECHFKGEHRYSDITLGDFWGIEHIAPDMDDNKGTTLLITRTEKGKAIVEKLSKRVHLRDVDFGEAISRNMSYSKSCAMPKERDRFMSEIIYSSDFEATVKKHIRYSLKFKIKWLIKKCLKLTRGK